MRFEIETVSVWRNPEEIIEEYPCLKDFGFEIEEICKPKVRFIRDENGQRILFEDGLYVERIPYIKVDSFEELLRLRKAVNQDLIIHRDGNIIEIYDGYRE